MKHVISTSYTPPVDANGAVALLALDQWLEDGLKLEEGKYGLGFPFMYLLLTGSMGLKVTHSPACPHTDYFSLSALERRCVLLLRRGLIFFFFFLVHSQHVQVWHTRFGFCWKWETGNRI